MTYENRLREVCIEYVLMLEVSFLCERIIKIIPKFVIKRVEYIWLIFLDVDLLLKKVSYGS